MRATDHQRLAADPGLSAWVTAAAGTGKTHVLTDRVLRLLLTDCPPERILCLTFTKAAAAEMANRLHGRLGSWVAASEEDLRTRLAVLRFRLSTPFARLCYAGFRWKLNWLHTFR